jgi:hypothetical protein
MHKVLIYTELVTNRLSYIVDILLPKPFYQVEFTNDVNQFNQARIAKINYSQIKLDGAIQISNHGLLSQVNIKNITVDVVNNQGLIQLFNNQGEYGFDVFAASFYLVSRYEEYLPYTPDLHGRFTALQSTAGKHGFLQQALVNRYMNQLHKKLHEVYNMPAPPNAFSALITMDIDSAYAFLGKGFWRSCGAFARHIASADLHKAWQRAKTLMHKQADPYDTYTYFANSIQNHALPVMFFMSMGDYAKYDRNIYYNGKTMIQLIDQLKAIGTVGLHPSYNAIAKNTVEIECHRLQKALNTKTIHSRFHFLRLSLPASYRKLIEAGITNDYSMGYADNIGFRASIASPHYFFDIEKNQTTKLCIHPLMVMDATLHSYLKMTPDVACSAISSLVSEAKNYGGQFICLWHNDTISNTGIWQNWQQVFQHTLKQNSN